MNNNHNNNSYQDLEQIESLLLDEQDDQPTSFNNNVPFDVEKLKEVPYYKKPLVQIFFVFGIGLPFAFLVLSAFKGGSPSTVAHANSQIDPEKANLLSALEDQRRKNKQLELQNALLAQKELDVTIPKKTKPSSQTKTTSKPAPKVQPKAAPPPVKPQPAPRPAPRRANVRPTPVAKPQPVVTAPLPDPMAQWLATANQGHYTTTAITKKPSAALVSNIAPSLSESSGADDYPLLDDSRLNNALNSPLIDDDQLLKMINGESNPKPRIVAQRPKTTSSASSPTNLIDIGSSAKASLETSVVWTSRSTQPNKKYLLLLKEDFQNFSGKVILPEGTRLIAQVTNYSSSGLVAMEVTQILLKNQKISVPAGALAIEGKGGKPLKADLKQKGDSDFWANFGSVVAPGVERALDSANDTLVVQNGSVFRTNNRRDPLSSGVSGIADGVSNTLNRRINRSSRESIMSYFQFESGKTVYLKAYDDITF